MLTTTHSKRSGSEREHGRNQYGEVGRNRLALFRCRWIRNGHSLFDRRISGYGRGYRCSLRSINSVVTPLSSARRLILLYSFALGVVFRHLLLVGAFAHRRLVSIDSELGLNSLEQSRHWYWSPRAAIWVVFVDSQVGHGTTCSLPYASGSSPAGSGVSLMSITGPRCSLPVRVSLMAVRLPRLGFTSCRVDQIRFHNPGICIRDASRHSAQYLSSHSSDTRGRGRHPYQRRCCS